jgi:hypothetical protein
MSITFMASHLTKAEYNILMSHHVWSSEAITFRVIPIDSPCLDFLFTIHGLATLDEKRIHAMVLQVWNDSETTAYIEKEVSKAQDRNCQEVQETLTHLIHSLQVTLLKIKDKSSALKPHFNVYVDGKSIKNKELWANLQTFLANQKYSLPLQGTGMVVKAPFTCRACHGVNHPRGLCLFPKVKGWNGPLHCAEDDPRYRGQYYGRLV